MAKGRILAIDDEEFFRTFYRDLLEGEGYYVRTAASGRDALTCLRSEDFDLVVTDIHVTGMDGLAVTEAILRFNPDQEIMVVTGEQEVPLAVEAMKRGVSEYLPKPIHPEEFLLIVNKVLFRQSQRLEHRKLLDENLEYLTTLSYYRRCLAFLKIHDLDRLGDAILDTLMELLRAEGAALWLLAYGGRHYRLRGRRGLARVAAEEETLQPEAVRRGASSGEAALADADRILWVPLVDGLEPLGVIRVEAPSGREGFNRRDLKVAAMVAEFAASALFNVLRYRRLEQSSLRVPRGEAYTMAFFRDYIAKELHKGRRYGRQLSLVRLMVVNYAELRERFLDKDIATALEKVVAAVNTALRDADILAMAGPDEFQIMLPETDYWGSLVTQKRIRKALRGKLQLSDLKKKHPIEVLMRSAAYPADGATYEELLHVAGRRLEALRGSLFQRLRWRDQPFWGIVDQLLGQPADFHPGRGDELQVSPALTGFEDGLHSRYFRMPEGRLDEMLRAFCQEVVESSRIRGIIYRSCADFEAGRRSLPQAEALEKTATSVYLLGGSRRAAWDSQRLVPIYIEDAAFQQTVLLIYLNEDYAYALFARRLGSELLGFHSADFYFVENMLAKLQEQYQLQAQI